MGPEALVPSAYTTRKVDIPGSSPVSCSIISFCVMSVDHLPGIQHIRSFAQMGLPQQKQKVTGSDLKVKCP